MKKVFLIDGHALIFRMYYAFLRRPMINTKGIDTSILFGFTKYILDLIKRESPTHLAVAFDPPAKTFRHEIYPEYKATRSATPELVKEALEPLTEIVKALGIPVFMMPGFEADDVIGSLAKSLEMRGFDTYMVTPDKDYGQLVSDHIFQYKPGKSSEENIIIDKEYIKAQYNIEDPLQVIDILTIWGDASDNVKGVTSVGEVGAKKLIAKYKSVENIYEHLDELTPKLKSSFIDAKEHIALSKYLVTIKSDIEMEIDEDDLILQPKYCQKVAELFDYYEFNSLLKYIDCSESEEEVKIEKNTLDCCAVGIEELIESVKSDNLVALRIAGDSLILAHDKRYSEIAIANSASKEIIENKSITKIGYSLKEDIKYLRKRGIKLRGAIQDIEIMHYLLNPERSHKLEILAKTYLDIDLNKSEDSVDAPSQLDLFAQVDNENNESSELAKRESIALFKMAPKIMQEIENEGISSLYNNLEMALIYVLAEMELEGVKIDLEQLRRYGVELQNEIKEYEIKARELAQEPNLNLSSPKQLGIVLYEKLKLNPKVRKNQKNNYPTDEETLSELREIHPIIDIILEYRAVKKLYSTYIEPFPNLIDPKSGKVHTTFNQALTATGRLSSIRPNLQNIPIRSEKGKEIRKAFIPSQPDGYILSADYSQIELRLMADQSGDSDLIEAFNQGKDIHTATAAKIFEVPENEVTKEQRRRAKVANFGIIYGISAFGLSKRLGIGRGESKEFIEEYFIKYPAIKNYMNRTIEYAKENGYVKTILNRKRYIPDINSNNKVVKGLAERNAINAPIQGSAADLIKLAMINIFRRMIIEGFQSKMILQVHDELVFDVLPQEVDSLSRLVKEEMESVFKLSIPLTVDCNYGKNWLEAH